jgi:hypothetical protein
VEFKGNTYIVAWKQEPVDRPKVRALHLNHSFTDFQAVIRVDKDLVELADGTSFENPCPLEPWFSFAGSLMLVLSGIKLPYTSGQTTADLIWFNMVRGVVVLLTA